MIEDLDHLAARLDQLIKLTQDLRAENRALQSELGTRDAHIHRLRDTLASAQTRVDGVLARLPIPPSEAVDEEAEDLDAPDQAIDPSQPTARSTYGAP